jgi:diguanylate cyclase (GGDEF)-like protein
MLDAPATDAAHGDDERSARLPDFSGVVVARVGRRAGTAAAGTREDGESAGEVDRLLDDSWDERADAYGRRQLLTASAMSLAFIVVAVALAVLAPHAEARAPLGMLIALTVGVAISSRIEFPIGAGYAVPTQLFLVALFVLAPAPLVPLMVLAGHTSAAIIDRLRGRVRADRLADVGVDSWHAIGPAVVIALAGMPDPAHAAVWLFAVAFVAQVTAEVATSTLRVWVGLGIPPKLQLRVLVTVWAIDLMLTPIGFVAAMATRISGLGGAPLALFGIIALLAVLTRDRTARIDQAHDRLEALRAERSRLEIAVQRIGDAFASKLDLDALLNITMRAAVEALDADGARASAHPGAGRRLVRRARTGDDPALEAAMAAAEQATADTGDLCLAELGDVYAVASPVRNPSGSPMAGVIVLARRGRPFTERGHELLGYLCEQAGVAASDIERHATLHRQALSDELTGLANHRRLQEVLALGADTYAQSGTSLALILFDLDNFKQVNDTRGHQTGDHVLRATSEVLRSCCRAGDEAARYGGEELAIVMQATDFPGVVAVAERARAAIAALQLVDTEGRDLTVTTSVGVAALGPGIRDPRALIAAADAALYEAKHAGKNRVHFHAGTTAA